MPPRLVANGKTSVLQEVTQQKDLKAGTWLKENEQTIVCFDLLKGQSQLMM